MTNYIAVELTEFEKKMSGYIMLFNYRMTNLCVKAEPTALLPVTVALDSSEYNFEDVAVTMRPNEFTFDVYPKNQNNLQAIVRGVEEMHPEFKMEVKTEKQDDGKEIHHVVYTMPDVDKTRRDLINETSKIFHKECLAKLNVCYVKQQTQMTEAFEHLSASDVDEAKDSLKKIYEESKKQADKLLDAKLQETEEAYQHYLEGKKDDNQKDGSGFDVTKAMKLPQQ